MAVRGLAAIQRRFKQLQRNAFDQLVDTMERQAEIVHTVSRDRAPQLTGQMIRNSGTRTQSSRAAGLVRVTVFYNEPYAIFQHEGFYHPGPVTSEKLGGAFAIGRKFLTRTVDEQRDSIITACGRDLERVLRLSLR